MGLKDILDPPTSKTQTQGDEPTSDNAHAYKVEQVWAGWWGGFGMDRHVESRLNQYGRDGWRLADSRSHIRFWWWIVPRPKLLLIFEK